MRGMSDHFNKIHLSTVQRISCLFQSSIKMVHTVYATMALFFIQVLRYVCMCMMKIFGGGGGGATDFLFVSGVVTPLTPSPYKQLLPLPTPFLDVSGKIP